MRTAWSLSQTRKMNQLAISNATCAAMPQYGCHIYLNMQSNFTNFSNVVIAPLHPPLRLPQEIILDLSIKIDVCQRNQGRTMPRLIPLRRTFSCSITFVTCFQTTRTDVLYVTVQNDCLGVQIKLFNFTNKTLFQNNWTYSKLCPAPHWNAAPHLGMPAAIELYLSDYLKCKSGRPVLALYPKLLT